MKLLLLAAGALGLGAFSSATQQQEPEIEVIPVAGQVSMLMGYGGNIGVMNGEDGILMIDTQFGHLEEKIRKAMATIAKGSPSYVINTHWHGDHVGGNLGFGADALLVAHQNVRARMIKGGRGAGPADPAALPEITYNQGLTLHWNGEAVHLVFIPVGHTDGDTVVFFPESKVVHMGDLLFNRMFPFVDAESGGNVRGYLQSMEAVLAKVDDDMTIIPGHGKVAKKADLQASVDMVKDCISIMEGRIKNGLSVKEAVDAGLPDKYASWSWGFIPTEKWLGTLYDDLSAEKK